MMIFFLSEKIRNLEIRVSFGHLRFCFKPFIAITVSSSGCLINIFFDIIIVTALSKNETEESYIFRPRNGDLD